MTVVQVASAEGTLQAMFGAYLVNSVDEVRGRLLYAIIAALIVSVITCVPMLLLLRNRGPRRWPWSTILWTGLLQSVLFVLAMTWSLSPPGLSYGLVAFPSLCAANCLAVWVARRSTERSGEART